MAAGDRLTGTAVAVRFTPDGGSPVLIFGDATKFSFDRKLDTADATAGNDQERTAVGTIETLDWTLTTFDANQAWLDEVQPRAFGLLEYMKEGVGVGRPILSFNTLITGCKVDSPFDDMLEMEITGVRQGAMVQDVGSVQVA